MENHIINDKNYEEPLEDFETEAIISYPRVVIGHKERFGGIHCHVCDNKDYRCPHCGGKGTPWLI